ncbi:PTS Lac IIA [Lactobacillus helsingborgensis]|jgi:Phosphotransferase system cellobiose-specific component IIA|uniref:PTS system lactose-specific EIIA component n=1 Tax=Lactobacillus helsingborgensis TaxID=1218494 RepID=A0AA47B2K9_9LACO|nr:PTS lactose/cellobiose transporter subunit IIA [Lactobacillus helsingborgensis]MCT6888864.1 PTS lactose/cellobiose transporter subunit IIA [Lactobacillus sp.]KJY64961.1 PTS Lac IIA [Lactobacillus helsingborgensis]MCT6847374.1 PTS lactose/cellobiose transporter subunit IIA [Lactobacillus helsingborgensis]UZX28966.1 PTS lactose/cellobiose transporter subunit IIA [Lactobacillus helsingborgensis]UZX30789.1 PTS lactose/cellobiose transporter subunit IIA [Lactobacillus helsingborgensis]
MDLENQSKEQKIQLMAFEIISNSGDAFDYFYQSVEKAQNANFKEAEILQKKGNESLNKAHKSQTGLLVSETNKEDIPYSILMVHAQDHLTMAIFFGRMSKLFINLWKEIHKNE